MRSFEERIAEIYRRSEEIVAQRKRRRKHILIACIPLVLCATVFASFILPAMMPAGRKDAAAPENMLADAAGNAGLFAAEVKVTGPNLVLIHTRQSEVSKISDYISQCTMEPPGTPETPDKFGAANGAVGKEEVSDSDYAGISDAVSTGYTVTLVWEDGSKTEYRLEGDMLICISTGRSYPLCMTQINELKTLLCLPL